MHATVDKEGCISCGICVSTCPEVFSFDEDEKAEAITDDIPEACFAQTESARNACPVSVIDIET